jgi:hypothetical protein
MMYPNPRNRHNFEYPTDRLLSLQGIIKDDELRKPTMYDKGNERCITVLKPGKTKHSVMKPLSGGISPLK